MIRPTSGPRGRIADLNKGAAAGDLVLLSQGEARFPMEPTLTAPLGVKGHRPVVGTCDCKHLPGVFAVVNAASAAAHANIDNAPWQAGEAVRAALATTAP